MQMHDAENAAGLVDHNDGSDLALLHKVERLAGQDVRTNRLRIACHSGLGGHFQGCAAMLFHQAAQIAIGEDACEAAIGLQNRGHAEAFAAHFVNDVWHRGVSRDSGKSIASVHLMLDAEKFLAETPCGMKRGEIIGAEATPFEKRDRESVADGHGDGGARGGREIERASFLADADVERDVASFGKSGGSLAGQRDERNIQALEGFEETDDFFGFAAVGDSEHRVTAREHAQIAMQSFRRMQKKGRRAGARKRGGNFSRDQAGLAHAGDDDTAFAGEENINGFHKGGVEPREDVLDGLRFDFEHTARGVQAHCTLQRRTTVESSFKRLRRAGSCASGSALGPSESAAAGLSCVSRKMPSTPAATPARASGSMNSGWPPLAWPCPPGSCTECVTSKTTG